MSYDFSGYATKNDLRCGDGLVIRRDAFKDDDNARVPLVWQHIHNDPGNVLGHADLKNRSDGVYAYCKFNSTPSGQNAKELVKHGDVNALSIYANRLTKNGNDVIHGKIREVSLVLAGANPGALIDPLSIAHADGSYSEVEDEAIIYTGECIEAYIQHDGEDENMAHYDDDGTIQDVLDSMNDTQRDVVEYLVGQALNSNSDDYDEESDEEPDEEPDGDDYDEDYDDDDFSHADSEDDEDDEEETVQDVLKTLNKKQLKVVEFLVGQALSEGQSAEHSDFYDDDYYMEDDMKFNAFDYNGEDDVMELSHSDIEEYIGAAKTGSNGSLKQEFLSHGIENLEVLYPEAKLVGQNPELITRKMDWVDKVWNAVGKTPFARIKSVAANITEYEARARGYVKGDQKIEEVLSLLSRTTTPQTVYKIQKIDRDDVIDITDLDIVAWMKREMRVMLNEEIVRALLIGDDRPSTDQSYIKPSHIRPIYQDSDLYTIHDKVTIGSSASFNDIADTIIEHAVLARKDYMGSGTPTMYASTDVITRMLLAKDQLGHRMYRNESELAAALRVKEIVEVPIFDGVTRTASVSTTNNGVTTTTQETRKLLAIIVNLSDYNIGADKGGAVNLFDDFDLNFNKYEYLIETRCSGALIRPYSAIAIETAGDLPFTFGTISGMYANSRTAAALAGETGETGDTE